jgi:hypothetical protein
MCFCSYVLYCCWLLLVHSATYTFIKYRIHKNIFLIPFSVLSIDTIQSQFTQTIRKYFFFVYSSIIANVHVFVNIIIILFVNLWMVFLWIIRFHYWAHILITIQLALNQQFAQIFVYRNILFKIIIKHQIMI